MHISISGIWKEKPTITDDRDSVNLADLAVPTTASAVLLFDLRQHHMAVFRRVMLAAINGTPRFGTCK